MERVTKMEYEAFSNGFTLKTKEGEIETDEVVYASDGYRTIGKEILNRIITLSKDAETSRVEIEIRIKNKQ